VSLLWIHPTKARGRGPTAGFQRCGVDDFEEVGGEGGGGSPHHHHPKAKKQGHPGWCLYRVM